MSIVFINFLGVFDMTEFRVRLKQLRTDRSIFQKDIAKHLNISIRAYQLYESGDGFPSFQGLLALAEYLNVSIDYLVGRSDDPKRH